MMAAHYSCPSLPRRRTTRTPRAMDKRDPMTPGGLRLDPACLSWRFSRSSGPGGQHVNTASSRAELRCDLAAAGLPDELRERLVARLGTEDVRIVASTERSQLRNRRTA